MTGSPRPSHSPTGYAAVPVVTTTSAAAADPASDGSATMNGSTPARSLLEHAEDIELVGLHPPADRRSRKGSSIGSRRSIAKHPDGPGAHDDAGVSDDDDSYVEAPELPRPPPPSLESAGWWSRAFFLWVSPIIDQRESIEEHTLDDLSAWDQSEFLSQKLTEAWQDEVARAGPAGEPSLARALFRTFKSQILLSGLFAFIEIFAKLGEAIFLGEMIRGFQTKGVGPSSDGYWWALALSLATAFHGMLHHWFFFVGMRLGFQLRISLTSIMYRKAISLAAGAASPGIVVNLVSNDVATFEQLALFGHFIWVAIIEVPVCAVLLYMNLSWPSLLGIAVIGLMLPMQGVFGNLFHQFRKATVVWRDSRIRLMSDLISGINVVKFNAWLTPFVAEVSRLRKAEMKYLTRSGFMDALNEASFFAFPLLVSLVTYASSVGVGKPLNPADVFSSVSLFNILRLTVTMFVPKAIKSATESLVSLRRVSEFLLEPESGADLIGAEGAAPPAGTDSSTAIRFTNAEYAWEGFKLCIDDLAIRKGELTTIVGPVGSGKSSLAQALLNEMPRVSPASSLYVDPANRRMAYAPQTPWILAGTVLDNILFSSPLDEPWLRQVIAICSLERDLLQWPHGLATVISDKATISGGQRARIGLARAVYALGPNPRDSSKPSTLILDDPLGALDTRVGKAIFEAILHAPALQNTTRILVTHQLQFLRASPGRLVCLEGGRIAAQGTWDDVMAHHHRVAEAEGAEVANKSFLAVLAQYEDGQAADMDVEHEDDVDPNAAKKPAPGTSEEAVDLKGDRRGAARAAQDNQETSQVGTVRWSTFTRFLIAPTPLILLITVFVSMFGGQALAVSSDWTLARWVGKPANVQLEDSYYMILFCSLIAGAVFVGIARAILVYFLILNSSNTVSQSMVSTVLDAPMAWFTKNPVGRILNRFSKDQSTIDEQLPSVFFNFMQCLFQSIGVVVVVVMVLPWVAISVPILGAGFFLLRRWYIQASRRIKRIESTTRSPVYSLLSTSLEGLPVIRALQAQPLFVARFAEYQDTNTRAVFAQAACARWLGLRLDLISSAFLAIAAFAAQAIAISGTLSPSLAGLALSYTLQLNGLLQWMVRQSVECEVMFVAVERMLEYLDIPGERDHPSRAVPPADWPTSGNLVIRDMSLTYPGTDKKVLKSWNVEFKSGEKIGIVGRTGAGKSSALQALFRMYDYEGAMLLDGIDTSTLALEELRKRLAVIPQEPFLFSGPLRMNLSPFGEYSDAELWRALGRVGLKEAVERLDGKLDAPVIDGGSNFSTGERQLLCLARSLLKRARVLVCDEASANIDYRSDQLIQNVLKTEFEDTLILTVAHRLSTIVGYDRCAVIDAGRIVEIGHAYELLQRRDGLFHKMVADTGEDGARQLWDLARESWDEKQRKMQQA
ncbi:hypothetical protein H9P43_000642 [Blastocladiella emersonii ATCC 22665]|nr:hypothetical protein H9P43_000642 [Blastocladiella emersonii ATCC 22665]